MIVANMKRLSYISSFYIISRAKRRTARRSQISNTIIICKSFAYLNQNFNTGNFQQKNVWSNFTLLSKYLLVNIKKHVNKFE